MPYNHLISGHRIGKDQFSFQSQRKARPKNVQITLQLLSFHMLARLCSKPFNLGFSSIWTKNFKMYKLDLEKAEEREIKLTTFIGSWRNQRNFRKTATSASLPKRKPLTLWITTNWKQQTGKFLKRWEYRTTLPASWEAHMQDKKQQLETDIEQWTSSKLGKEYIKAVYCHPAYLISMQSTSCEMLGWIKHRVESRLLEEISITSDIQVTPP